MHRPTILAYLVFIFIALVLPAPRSGVPRAECFTSTTLEAQLSPTAYVDGRPFFGTYENRAHAVAYAKRINACVENFGVIVEEVEPRWKFALRIKKQRGFTVFGEYATKKPTDYFRIVWRDRTTGAIRHSMWFTGSTNPLNQVEWAFNTLYGERYIFWVELSI